MAGGERDDAVAMDSGEKRLNELGYKQELRREMVLFGSHAIFSSVFMFSCSS